MILTDLQKIILEKRGFDLKNEIEIEKFLNPNWTHDTYDPYLMKDMGKVVERIRKAINENQKIIIYADYDCDGIPGAVVLHDFFEKLNYKNFSVYIPHRHSEGYGLNKNAVQKFIDEKVDLIITIDLGITNFEEIDFAKENKIDVMVTDHHLPLLDKKEKQILPNAFAIVNTKQDNCNYPEKFLCGASTIWKVVHAFLNKYRNEFNIVEGWEKWLLDMVGIATVADLMPLTNENRLFAKFGLQVLQKSKRPGFQKILKNAKVDQKKINEDDIAFYIAPRINSASRMAEPIHAFYALLQNHESMNYADELEKYNELRKRETKEANASINFEKFLEKKIIFIGDEKWGAGILGLIASRVCEDTGKTCFVYGGEEGEIMKGSVRAGSDGVNVVEIMTNTKDLLENFGGHEMAGGFTIHKNNLEKFKKYLESVEINKNETLKVEREEDFSFNSRNINKNLFNELKIFEPFGIENPKPIFKIKLNEDEKVIIKRFGKNSEHLELNISGIRGIEFFIKEDREEFLKNQKEFLVNLEWDNYKNNIVLKFLR